MDSLDKELAKAVENRDLAYAQGTLSAGANPENARLRQNGLLSAAFDQGDDAMIVLLARNGLTVDPATGDSAVNLVVQLESLPALEQLLAIGTTPDLSSFSTRASDGCPQVVLDAFRTGEPAILTLADRLGVPVFDSSRWGQQDIVFLTTLWGHEEVQEILEDRGLESPGEKWKSAAAQNWYFDQLHLSDWRSHPFAAKGYTEPTDSHRRMWTRLANEAKDEGANLSDRLRGQIFRLNIWRRLGSRDVPTISRVQDDADTLRIWIALGFDPGTIPDYFPGQAVRAGCREMVALLREHDIETPYRDIHPGSLDFWENRPQTEWPEGSTNWGSAEDLYQAKDYMGAYAMADQMWQSGNHTPRGAMLKALTTFQLIPILVSERIREKADQADRKQEFLDADPFDRSHRAYPDYIATQMLSDAADSLRHLNETMDRISNSPAGWAQDDALFYRQNLPFLLEQVAYPLAAIVALDREEIMRPQMISYREELNALWRETAEFFRIEFERIPTRVWDARAANSVYRASDEDDFFENTLLHYFEGPLGMSPEVAATVRPRLLGAITKPTRGEQLLPSLGPDRIRFPGAWRKLQAHARTLRDDPWARLVDSYINTAIWRRNTGDRIAALEARTAFLDWADDVLRTHSPTAQDMIYGAAGAMGRWLRELPNPPLGPLRIALHERGMSIPREFLDEDIRSATRWLYLITGQPNDRNYVSVASEMSRLIESRSGWKAFRKTLFDRLNDPWLPATKDKMEEWISEADEEITEIDENLQELKTATMNSSEREFPIAGKLLHDPRQPSLWQGPSPNSAKYIVTMVPMGDWCVFHCKFPKEPYGLMDLFFRHDFKTGSTELIGSLPEEMQNRETPKAGATATHLFLWSQNSGLRVVDLEGRTWVHPLKTTNNPPSEISVCANREGIIFVYLRHGSVSEDLELLRYDPHADQLSTIIRFDRSVLGERLSAYNDYTLKLIDNRYLFLTTNGIVPESVFDLAIGSWVPNRGASDELAGAVPGVQSTQPVTARDLTHHRPRRGLDSWNKEWNWDYRIERADSSDPSLAKISFRKRHSREDPVEVTFRLFDTSGGGFPEPTDTESFRILGIKEMATGVFIRFSKPFLGVWLDADDIARLFRLSELES